jgi:hypothetical protein
MVAMPSGDDDITDIQGPNLNPLKLTKLAAGDAELGRPCS